VVTALSSAASSRSRRRHRIHSERLSPCPFARCLARLFWSELHLNPTKSSLFSPESERSIAPKSRVEQKYGTPSRYTPGVFACGLNVRARNERRPRSWRIGAPFVRLLWVPVLNSSVQRSGVISRKLSELATAVSFQTLRCPLHRLTRKTPRDRPIAFLSSHHSQYILLSSAHLIPLAD